MQNILIFQPMCPADSQVATYLRRAGYQVFQSSLDGAGGSATLSDAFDGKPPGVVLADLSKTIDCLPLREARRVLRSVWSDERWSPLVLGLLDTPHLMHPDWTALVDDFLLPPYSADEVLARIRLLLFRRRHVLAGNTIELPGLTIELDSGRAIGANHCALDLTPREYELLRFLASHKGKFFARGRLIDLVWGVNFEGGERTVDIHVLRLRAKLPTAAAELLETQRGIGYGFRAT